MGSESASNQPLKRVWQLDPNQFRGVKEPEYLSVFYSYSAMTHYAKYNVTLTNSQLDSLQKAVSGKKGITMKFAHDSLMDGTHAIGLTQRQIQHIEKAKKDGKGVKIELSKTQVMKQGGFLGALLNIATSVLPKLAMAGLEGLTSAAANKLMSGSGADLGGCLVLPKSDLSENDRKMLQNIGAKEHKGGFLIPLATTLIASLLPSLFQKIAGNGMQIRAAPKN